MELLLIKKLMEKKLLDFDKLLKNTYRQIGLKEIEAFFIMELYSLKMKGETQINPTELIKNLSVSENEATELLDSMMQRDYLSFEIRENKGGKTTESFSLDQTINKIVEYYKSEIEKDIVKTKNTTETDENEIAEILETQLQRQLKPMEIEVIIKWMKEYKYDKLTIKDAIIEAVKSGKTSISYIDGILLKKKQNKDNKVSKTNRKKSDILKEFLES
ncbi:MAG: DnaD domain protein [Tenericutes bacterium]|jgi:DnaD/phage-associated family protein|nr:DnaD domain protein [Mycoplasmatota bacterium]